LQKRGYEDMAVDYLKSQLEKGRLPPEVREVFDLEMSNCLRGAATHAFDAKEAEQRMADAQTHLNKFLKEWPEHPAAVSAMVTWGDLCMDRAFVHLRNALGTEDKEQKTKLLADARTALEEANTQFKQAAQKFTIRMQNLPEIPADTGRNRRARQAAIEARQEAEADFLDSRGKLSLVQYYLAQTYEDPKDPTRRAALEAAAKGFDSVYQVNRLNMIGLFAHMWHGKTMEELGDLQTAVDIYEEVLAAAPEPGEARADPDLEALFAQVEYFRFIILRKQKPDEFLPEAEPWLKFYSRLKETAGFQGIAMEVAKAKLAAADKATGVEKGRLTKDALDLLRAMTQVVSPYQQEAFKLRRQNSAAAASAEPTTFDESLALANDAHGAARWEDAVKLYEKALDFAAKARTKEQPERVTAARDGLAYCLYAVARNQYAASKFEECLTTTGRIVGQHDTSEVAINAASLAVVAALNLHVNAPADQKEATLARLVKVADFTATKWPAKAEADDARMALGQAHLAGGKINEALQVFENVNPKSERYGQALFYAGRTYWGRYLMEKPKPDGQRAADQMTGDRTKALERLTASLQLQRTKAEEQAKPDPKAKPEKQDEAAIQAEQQRAAQLLNETHLLLGEVSLEGGQAKEAAAYFLPLIDGLQANKPQTLDNTVMRIFVGTVRSNVGAGDLAKAAVAASLLGDLGPDVPQINGWLMEFGKLLRAQSKQADADHISAPEGPTKDAAAAKLAVAKDAVGQVLKKLAGRQMSVAGMCFVADTFAEIGLMTEARDQYQAILKRMEADAEFAKSGAKAVTRIRTQLLGLLAKEGQYEEALKQVKAVVAANPRALEPLMEQGRILQTWAEKDPKHYSEAVAHWATVRNKLHGLKERPPEYYEVVYNVAFCLYEEWRFAKDKDKTAALEKAKQGEQLLNFTLFESASLNGPDMVARYKELAKKLAVAQGRKPGPAATAKTAPAPKS
jgi:hypothetical protein